MHLEELIRRRDQAARAAHRILEGHESAASRVVVLSQTFAKLSGLAVDVEQYYRESLKSLEVGCYRAAVVLAWSGFVHSLADSLVNKHGSALSTAYPKWPTASTANLLEAVPEAQVLEAGKKVGMFSQQKLNIYKGWLSTRNQCAHPTLFAPSRNITLGFVDAVIVEVAVYL